MSSPVFGHSCHFPARDLVRRLRQNSGATIRRLLVAIFSVALMASGAGLASANSAAASTVSASAATANTSVAATSAASQPEPTNQQKLPEKTTTPRKTTTRGDVPSTHKKPKLSRITKKHLPYVSLGFVGSSAKLTADAKRSLAQLVELSTLKWGKAFTIDITNGAPSGAISVNAGASPGKQHKVSNAVRKKQANAVINAVRKNGYKGQITGLTSSTSSLPSQTRNAADGISLRNLSNGNCTAGMVTCKPTAVSHPSYKFTVNYFANGGSGSMGSNSCSLVYSGYSCSYTIRPNAFTRSGYKFVNWLTSAGYIWESGTATASGRSNQTVRLSAQWKLLVPHTVTFDPNGGTGSMSNQTVTGQGMLAENKFGSPQTGHGFVFAGWNTAANGKGTSYADKASYDFDSDLKLYAQWTPNYAVSFDANGGSGSIAQQVNYLPANLSANTFTKNSSNFMGWNTSADGKGTSYADGASYAFNADVTLFAQWSERRLVQFDNNGGSGSMNTQVAAAATALSANTLTRNGFVFTGWNTDPHGGGDAYADKAMFPFTAKISTLYAQWNATHTVTFDANYPNAPSLTPQVSAVSQALTRSPGTRLGFSFAEWNTAADGSGTAYSFGQSYAFTADLALFAQWKRQSSTAQVQFVANPQGGLVNGSMPSISSDQPLALTANTFTSTGGYVFTGWNTASNGSGTAYADQAVFPFDTAPPQTTLFAQWGLNRTVMFYSGGGTGTMANQVAAVASPLSANLFTKPGYAFAGWQHSAGGTQGAIYTDGQVFDFANASLFFGGTATMVAQWVPGHTVTFDSNVPVDPKSGNPAGTVTGVMDDQTGAGTTLLHANAYSLHAYVFTGWNTSSDGNGIAFADRAAFDFSADQTLYAQWTQANTVIFNANGGYSTGGISVSMADQYAIAPTPLHLSAFTTNGLSQSFIGWNTGQYGDGAWYADGAVFPFTDRETTLYAQWGTVRTVTFNANGGAGAMASQTSGAPAALKSNTFTRAHYTFAGWATSLASPIMYNDGDTYPFSSNGTLYAVWTPANATVTFDINGADGGEKMDPVTSATPQALPANTFTDSNMTFDGWNTATDGSGTWYADQAQFPFDANTVLYAQWKLSLMHSVSFLPGAGIGFTRTMYSATPKPLVHVSFTGAAGTAFNGWNTAIDGSGVAFADGETYDFATDLVLYAQWAPIHTVTFSSNISPTNSSFTAQSAIGIPNVDTSTALTPNTFTRDEYTFTGWNTSADGRGTAYADKALYNFSTDLTLYAQWRLTTYTITFDSNGGAGTMAAWVSARTVQALPANTFTNTAHGFLGWNTDRNATTAQYANQAQYSVTGDQTLYAIWTQLYTVTFNPNGGTGTMPNQEFTPNTIAPLNPNTFTRAGYTFEGWNTKADGTGNSSPDKWGVTITAPSVTLYAQWSTTVTFDKNGGTGSMSAQTSGHGSPLANAALTANAFTRSGYTFAGWNTKSNGEGIAYADLATYPFTTTAGTTLFAQWAALHSVSFKSNNGSGTMADQISGTPTALTANTFTRSNYTFNGWNTADNGSGISYADQAQWTFASNLTLYAQWRQVAHTVTFVPVNNNGSGIGTGTGTMAPQTANGPTALNPNTFTPPAGYYFYSWSDGQFYGAKTYDDEAVYDFASDVTLYANWDHYYTVHFAANGGSGTMPDISNGTRNSSFTLPANSYTKDGYYFLGWRNSAGTDFKPGTTFNYLGMPYDVTFTAQWAPVPLAPQPTFLTGTGTTGNGYPTGEQQIVTTADGLITQITNYDPAFAWAGTTNKGGTVTITQEGTSANALVKVTGVNAGTSGVILTVTTSKTNYTSGTASLDAIRTRTTCAGGSATCQLGQVGPGGGIVYYTDRNAASGSKNYEVALPGWSQGRFQDPTLKFGCDTTDVTGLPGGSGKNGTEFGDGKTNTAWLVGSAVTTACGTTPAAQAANSYQAGGSSWSLPSASELDALYQYKSALTAGGFASFTNASAYSTSSQSSGTTAWGIDFSTGDSTSNSKATAFPTRPIRTF